MVRNVVVYQIDLKKITKCNGYFFISYFVRFSLIAALHSTSTTMEAISFITTTSTTLITEFTAVNTTLIGSTYTSDMQVKNNATVDEPPGLRYSIPQTVVLAIIATLLSILTVAGNVMVMISFKIDKQLQTISNYFLFSLAIADFAIGLISMPLFTVTTLLGECIINCS